MRQLLDYLNDGLNSLNISLSEHAKSTLLRYQAEVLLENERQNLTAVTDPKEFVSLHIIDSLALYALVKPDDNLIDIGTGAGFPGMILKIAYPDLKLTLLDSLNKRLTFLKRMCSAFELTDVEIVHARAEEAARSRAFRESYDVAVSRAVAPLPALCEYCIPFVKPGGRFIAMKGKNAYQELVGSGKAHERLGCAAPVSHDFTLFDSGAARTLFVYEKTKKTPDKYPRNQRQIKNDPLS